MPPWGREHADTIAAARGRACSPLGLGHELALGGVEPDDLHLRRRRRHGNLGLLATAAIGAAPPLGVGSRRFLRPVSDPAVRRSSDW